jgi:hypothetical protein
VTVCYYQCPTCMYREQYDGMQDRIFNHSNTTLVAHELFNEYTEWATCNQITFHGFIRAKNNHYMGQHCNPQNKILPFLNRTTFFSCYDTFINLQAYDYKYTCVSCGSQPDRIIVDGTHLDIPLAYAGN